MDVGQVERYIRAYIQCTLDTFILAHRTLLQAPRPSPGPHKLRESLPLTIFLRNRLKYALNGREVTSIVKQRLIKVDGKVRTDTTYPTGFMGNLLFLSLISSYFYAD
jgi:ribosomal protein S4E